MALGGKAFCTLTGDVSNVRAAVDAGAKAIATKGLLVNSAVIPAPNPALFRPPALPCENLLIGPIPRRVKGRESKKIGAHEPR